MIQNELIARSPLRILESSTHGGLGKGNLGVLAARRGVGKTACLVHIATDQLLRGRHVIHVSFAMNTGHIVDWYEDIFREIAVAYGLDQTMAVHDDIVRHRIIMNFNQQTMRLTQAIGSVRSMIRDGHFAADCVVVDGYDLSRGGLEELRQVRAFAADQGLEIWFSASLGDQEPRYDEAGVPEPLAPLLSEISVLICLRSEGKHVRLQLVKDHDQPSAQNPHLELDPKTLLIARE